MATDQSALTELLEALKATSVDERVRIALHQAFQALIDMEAERLISVGLWKATENRAAIKRVSSPSPVNAGLGPGVGVPKLPTESVSIPFWSAADGSTWRFSRSASRPIFTE